MGRTTERGYGRAHRKLRGQYQASMDAGVVYYCWRCASEGRTTPIDPEHWHLGHDDHDRDRYRGPECVPCNTATHGRGGPTWWQL